MAFQCNQLEFQTGIPANPHNLAFKHHRPSPIFIDKGQGLPANCHSNKNAVQHSQANTSVNTSGNSI